MRTICIGVGDELAQDGAQVLFIEDNEVVEALARGARNAVSKAWVPSARSRLASSGPYAPSRSRSRYFGVVPHGVAWRNCRQIQARSGVS